LKTIDKDHILQKTLLKIEKITNDPKMTVTKIDEISSAAGSLWRWVLAMEMYSKAFKDIEPKRNKVKTLREKLKKSEEDL
jgi:dynein heavy chain